MGMAENRSIVNPFIFPSELKFYFALILVTTVAPAMGLAFSIWKFLIDSANLLSISLYYQIVPFLTFVLLPVLSFYFYEKNVKHKLHLPKIRMEERYPKISELIEGLCRKLNVRVPATFCLNDEGLNAVAVGFRNKPFLFVSKGLCRQFETFPELVETALLHELSHIKNGDVVYHEIAESLWKSFALVGLVGSLFGLMIYFERPFSWLFMVSLVYAFPSIIIFYLNNELHKWREVYADVRVIAVQRTDRNIITFLRLFCGVPTFGMLHRFKSPFILSNVKRIRIIEDGIFRHVIERIFLCSIISVLYLFSIMLFLVFSWNVTGSTWILNVFIILWFLVTVLLLWITALPYWTHTLINRRNLYSSILQLFTVPIKVTVFSMIPIIAVQSLFTISEVQICLFLLVYLLLIVHYLLFCLMLSFASLNLKPKAKIMIPNLFLLILPIETILYYLNMESCLGIFVAGVVVAVMSALLIAAAKYSKCPYCGKDVRQFSLFKCPYCLRRLNEDFLIWIEDKTTV